MGAALDPRMTSANLWGSGRDNFTLTNHDQATSISLSKRWNRTMRIYIAVSSFLACLSLAASTSHTEFFPVTNAALVPATTSGNTECSAASSNTTFQLTFISYGNWTALPGQDESPIQHLESVSFAVSNAANGVSTVCALSLGVTLSGNPGEVMADDDALNSHVPVPPSTGVPSWATVAAGVGKGGDDARAHMEVEAEAEAAWQACADRKDTDGKHRFTIATGAAFALADRSLAINQTWFCHDDADRLVAFTGIARTGLNLTCSESEVSGYHLRNCTSSDLALAVALL
ncbi:hypothetical protein GGR51DRAFT_188427 [Nemania sp. FL0031]|nr:hypothetical protein GGR51DRAFT_188427 [Nemania sp. FL0031]